MKLDSRKYDPVEAVRHEDRPRRVERLSPREGQAREGGDAAIGACVGGVGQVVRRDGGRLLGHASVEEALEDAMDVLLLARYQLPVIRREPTGSKGESSPCRGLEEPP